MIEFPRSLSVYARYVYVVLCELIKGQSKTVDPSALGLYFPEGQGPIIQAAIADLEGCGLVTRVGSRVRPAGDPTSELIAEFSEWWSLYPGFRKIKKLKCQEKYLRHRRQGITRDQMFDGLARWLICRDWSKDNGEFVMAPEVWLNGGCWDDTPEPMPGAVVKARIDKPWAETYLKHVADPRSPRAWELINFAASLGLQQAEDAAWILKSQGVDRAIEWIWERRA